MYIYHYSFWGLHVSFFDYQYIGIIPRVVCTRSRRLCVGGISVWVSFEQRIHLGAWYRRRFVHHWHFCNVEYGSDYRYSPLFMPYLGWLCRTLKPPIACAMSFCIVHTIHHFPAFVCWIYTFQKGRFYEVGYIPRIFSTQAEYDGHLRLAPSPGLSIRLLGHPRQSLLQHSNLHCLWLIPPTQ